VAAQILGLGAFDRTNSAQIIGTGPGIRAVMGGASVTPAPPKFNLKFLGLRGSTNSGTWCIRQHKLLHQVREFVLSWVVLASRTFSPPHRAGPTVSANFAVTFFYISTFKMKAGTYHFRLGILLTCQSNESRAMN